MGCRAGAREAAAWAGSRGHPQPHRAWEAAQKNEMNGNLGADASSTGALVAMDADALEQRRQYGIYLLSMATGRHGPSAVVRTISTLRYGFQLWKQEPDMRDAWAQRIVSYLDAHSCTAIPSSLEPVLPRIHNDVDLV